ncbi:MAG: hypothetical protein ACOC4M_17740 [Promethearchaeia archaeon]
MIDSKTLGVGVARMGADDRTIKANSLNKLRRIDFGDPPHTLILTGELHHTEKKYLVEMDDGPKELLKDS